MREERTKHCLVPPAPLLYARPEYYSLILNAYYFIKSYELKTFYFLVAYISGNTPFYNCLVKATIREVKNCYPCVWSFH